jgi:hypothetical protein
MPVNPFLTQVIVRELFDYDPDTGKLSWKKGSYAWIRRPDAHAGTVNNKGYRHVKINGFGYMVHRVIWLYMTGKMPEQVDHIDRDKFNNKWLNLREGETWQNCHNQGNRINNTSGFKGVQQSGDKFVALISVKVKRIYLGKFLTAEEAFEAYKQASFKYAGAFSAVIPHVVAA